MNPLYELVPISERPETKGLYHVLNDDGTTTTVFFKTDWFGLRKTDHSWFREIPDETLKARIREELGKAFEAGGSFEHYNDSGLPNPYPDRETYINSAIDVIFG